MTGLAIPICFLYFIAGTTALLLDRRKGKKDQISDYSASNIEAPENI